MHNLVYFVNLHMFRAYLGPSSGGTTVCLQQLVLSILFRWLSVVLVGQQSSKKNNKYQLLCTYGCTSWWWAWTTDGHIKRIISTNCCIRTVLPPDDGPRCARNMWRLTKYTKLLVVHQVGFYLRAYIEMHGQQNIKKHVFSNYLQIWGLE